jgi:3-deoxy-D-manno-octulosonic-acid transferase
MLFYNLSIWLFSLAINLATLFHAKAKLLANGRENTPKLLASFQRDAKLKLAWFHCASLGEFEQARPIMERLKARGDFQLAVSFFSPSGYEVRKDYAHADVVFYLPADTVAEARFLLNALKPDYVFLVKYEIWINLINQVKEQAIPLHLVSATFSPNFPYFKWYGGVFRKALRKFDCIFTQDHASTQLMAKFGFTNVTFSNDTRYDRVFDTCQNPKDLPVVKVFKTEQAVLVLGSSYAAEEELVAKYLRITDANLKVIIAPHVITPQRIAEIEKLFDKYAILKYSEASMLNAYRAQILIIDNIGLLSSIYQYADIAIIGGGFGNKGVHNTLEAATFGMPIYIGPNNHQLFPETGLLKEAGVLFTITSSEKFCVQLLTMLTDNNLRNKIKVQSQQFIRTNLGATALILNKVLG